MFILEQVGHLWLCALTQIYERTYLDSWTISVARKGNELRWLQWLGCSMARFTTGLQGQLEELLKSVFQAQMAQHLLGVTRYSPDWLRQAFEINKKLRTRTQHKNNKKLMMINHGSSWLLFLLLETGYSINHHENDNHKGQEWPRCGQHPSQPAKSVPVASASAKGTPFFTWNQLEVATSLGKIRLNDPS